MPKKTKEEKDEDKDLLKEARDRLKDCIDNEGPLRAKMKDDLRFKTLDQWPEDIRKQRETDPNGARPCLTIDKINQYISQVVNDMRQNRPAIKVRPVDDNADIDTAKVFQGGVRHIEDQSNASVAYETAGESQTTIGLGYFRVVTEFDSPKSFDQDIFIRAIPDTFSTYLGPHIEPDGSDAEYGFIMSELPLEEFRRKHPKAQYDSAQFSELGDKPVWRADKTITECEYFYKEYEAKELLFLADGTTTYADQYDGPEENIQERRSTQTCKVKWCKLTGIEILEKLPWAGKYIPIVEVIGKESWVDGRRMLWGLVRPAKDNLRMYNYWASAATEVMALAPKAQFIAAEGQIEGREVEWKNANKENRAVLQYKAIDINGNALPAPRRVEPPPIQAAMMGMMQTIEHDIQSSLGMFRAAVGEQQGQQSGRALLALERSSDTGTFNFPDNLSRSIRHCGKIIIDLFPKIYDTKRVIRILGEDGESDSAQLDPQQQVAKRQIKDLNGNVKTIYNLDVGTYDVTVTSGPSYNTKRMEASAVFSELAKGASDPASAAIMRYLTVKNSDFTSSDEAIAMLKSVLPPQALQAQESDEKIPPKAMAAMQQMQMKTQQMQEGLQKLSQENMQLKSGAQTGMAKVSADAQHKNEQIKLDATIQTQKQQLARDQFEFEKQLEIEKANHAIDLEERKAKAEHIRKNLEIDSQKQANALKMSLEHEARTQEQEFAAQSEAVSVTPKLEAALTKLNETLSKILEVSQQHFEWDQAPKKVGISGEKRDSTGKLIGATVTPTIQ